MDPPRPARTQARTERTRAALLNATVECLIRDGYRELSTNDVVRRAASSRGALAHHFPTKADLVRAAVTRLVDLRVAEFRLRLHDVPVAERTPAGAADVLWSFVADESFDALLDLLVAARREPELHQVLHDFPEQVIAVSLAEFAEVFPDVASRPHAELVLRAIVSMFVGQAVENGVAGVDDDTVERNAEVRALLAGALALIPRDEKEN